MRIPCLRAGSERYILFFSMIVVSVAMLLRNTGAYPVAFADEYYYSTFSRLLPLADSQVPDYLYLTIYRATKICGDEFLECARILNILFFVAATPLIYLTAKRVCPGRVASLVAILALLGPINSYTAYFMPESLYFFSFWLLTWFILRLQDPTHPRSWCFAGMLLGLTTLIKPHALFLLPAIVAYVFYVSRKRDGKWLLHAFANAGLFVVCTFLIKLLLGYSFAGKAGTTLFGPVYTTIASNATSNSERYLALLRLSITSAKGHALAICLLFGVPIVFAVNSVFHSMFSRADMKSDQRISFYTIAVLLNLMLVVALFTGSSDLITRLHMRYYNFAFPLLLMIAASQLSVESTMSTFRGRAITAFPIGAAILYAVYTHLAPFNPSFCDCPELRGVTFNSTVSYVMGGLSLLALGLGIYSARSGAKTFVYCVMPLAVVLSNVRVTRDWHTLVPDVFVKAGVFAKQYLSNDGLSKLLVVGSESDPGGLFKSLFYVDNPHASLKTIPKGVGYDLTKLPADKEWVLVIGDHSLSVNPSFELPMNGFTLARIDRTNTIDFKSSERSAWQGVILRTRGLSGAEDWGTWSDGDAVTIEWCMPLPEKFTVHLVAHAFGRNIGKEFVAHVGDNTVGFTLGAATEEKALVFSNPKRSRSFIIDIPSPTTPKEAGMPEGDRRLGIAFVELRIVPESNGFTLARPSR